MPSIFEVRDVNSLIWFAVWVLAITAATKAVFRSFLAAELTWWLRTRNEARDRQINQLNWEVHHRARYSPEAASGRGTAGGPKADAESLSDVEVGSKRDELLTLARGTFGQRMLNWFLNCTACQAFWLALAAYLAVRGVDGVMSPFASALAYSCAVVVLTGTVGIGPITADRMQLSASDQRRGPQTGPTGCPGCGK